MINEKIDARIRENKKWEKNRILRGRWIKWNLFGRGDGGGKTFEKLWIKFYRNYIRISDKWTSKVDGVEDKEK